MTKKFKIFVYMFLMTCASVKASFFDGFYFGGNVGGLETIVRIHPTTSALFTNFFTPTFSPNSVSLGAEGDAKQNFSATGTLFIGCGRVSSFSDFYLGGELYGNLAERSVYDKTTSTVFSSPSDSDFSLSLSTRTKARLNTAEFGLDAKPGFLVGPNTLVYGRVGAAFNKMNITSRSTFTNLQPITTSSTTLTISNLVGEKNKTITGLRLGVGLEGKLRACWSWNIDYIFTYYGKFRKTAVGPSLSPQASNIEDITVLQNGFINETSAHFKTQSLTLGLKYYFN